MPWEDKTVESSRFDFVTEALAQEISFSALCKKYNITRKTGYKWLERFNCGEPLADKSRVPFHTPNKTSLALENLILNTRLSHPAWGPRKLKKHLENKGYYNLPAFSTFAEILKRNNCISEEESLAHKPFIRFEKDSSNELWQVDFKGDFVMRNGSRCFPLTVLDDHSRYSLCIDAKLNQKGIGVFESFDKLFRTYGLPQAILCDNGNPWGTSQRIGFTKFEVWLMRLNILPIHGRIMHPQTQGKEERFHRTMNAELLKHTVILDLTNAQKQFEQWRYEYNYIRPHEALEMQVPADLYRESSIKMPDKINQYDYNEQKNIRRISSKGCLYFNYKNYFLSEVFAGETVNVVPSSENEIKIRYRDFFICKIDLNKKIIVNKKICRI